MSRWSGPHGAAGERADDAVRHQHRWDDAAEVDQSQSAQRGHSRFLWSVAVVAIYGSDESIGGANPQTPSLGPGTGWSVARSRWIRSARRSSIALRPHLPNRDAGRAEHWFDQLNVHLCPD